MTMPWEDAKAAQAATQPTAQTMPWEDAKAAQAPPDGWQDTPYGFKVKPIQIGNVQTVQRDDGAAYFGPDQGNKGAPGWFNAQGQRVGLKSGVGTMRQESFANPMDVLGQGATDLPVKAIQTGAHLFGSTAVDPYVTQREQDFQNQYGDSAGVKLARAAGSVMSMQGAGALAKVALEGASVPGFLQPVIDAGSKIKSAIQAVKGGKIALPIAESIGAGAVTQPAFTPEIDVKDNADFWSRQLPEMASGAMWGGGLGTTAAVLGQGIPAAVNGWANKFRNPKAAQLLDDLVATNNPMKASDIMTATTAAPPEVAAAEKTVMELKNELTNTMNNTKFAVGELPTVAASNGPRSGAAKAILEQAAQEGDPEKLLSTSAGIRAVQEKIRMDQLGSARSVLAEGVDVAPDKPLAILNQWKQELTGPDASKFPQKQSVINEIDALIDNLSNGQNSFTAMQRTRSDAGDRISSFYKGTNSEIGSKGAGYLQAFKNSINEAMSDAAQSSGKPGLQAADTLFNAEYSKYANTYKDPAIINVIQNPKPDTLMSTLAKAGPNKAQNIMDALDPKGQAAYAVGTFDQAIAKAVNKRTGGDIIPGNISGGINDVNDALGVVIKDPALKAKMNSMLNVMQALARTNPEQASALGQRITGSVVEANSKLGVVSKLYQAIKDHGVDMFFNTPEGKDFLFRVRNVKPESPMMMTLLNDSAPKILAAQASRNPQPSSNNTQTEQK